MWLNNREEEGKDTDWWNERTIGIVRKKTNAFRVIEKYNYLRTELYSKEERKSMSG